MATESKWAERIWSVVGLLAAVAGGGACVKVFVNSDAAPAQPKAAIIQPAPATTAPCYPPPAKASCATPMRW